jgi:hypothetical protein
MNDSPRANLILDYVAMCEKFGPLDFETFIDAWQDADAIARIEVGKRRDPELGAAARWKKKRPPSL